jgi:hypothetical protein
MAVMVSTSSIISIAVISNPSGRASAGARFGQYDLIDFVAVLIGYILSGEPIATSPPPALWGITEFSVK